MLPDFSAFLDTAPTLSRFLKPEVFLLISKLLQMKITKLVLAGFFLLFAIVQFNDPDPLRWILMYSFVAVCMALAAFGKQQRSLNWLGILASAAWAVTLVPGFLDWLKMGSPNIAGQMKAENPYIEFTREFLGLITCTIALAWLLWLSKRKQ